MILTTDERRILAMFETKDAKAWLKNNGREEIDAPHIPIGWLSLDDIAALRRMVKADLIEVRKLPARIAGRSDVQFMVLKERVK